MCEREATAGLVAERWRAWLIESVKVAYDSDADGPALTVVQRKPYALPLRISQRVGKLRI